MTAFLDPATTGNAIELTPGSQLPLYYMPVLVAQSTAFGMKRAAEMLGNWHPDLPRPWLVVVRDAPMAPPRPAKYRLRAIGSRVLGVAEVPYLYRLRGVDSPAEALEYRAVSRAAERLRRRFNLPK
ncbi:hypothetical protein [Streptomyces albiaxialis]|uniref:hypothetical protein n=1 Tax=Streptomyces albiaxialis TaxID=329523 RepID=UPI0031D24FC4